MRQVLRSRSATSVAFLSCLLVGLVALLLGLALALLLAALAMQLLVVRLGPRRLPDLPGRLVGGACYLVNDAHLSLLS